MQILSSDLLRPAPGPVALIIACLFFFGVPPFSWAQEPGVRAFNLAADDAEKSLKEFSKQSGRSMVMATSTVKGVRTHAVHGEFTPREALGRLLAGTGLIATHDEKSGGFTITQGNEQADQAAQKTTRGGRSPESQKKNATETLQHQKPMKRNNLLTRLAAVALGALTMEASEADLKVDVVSLSAFEVTATPTNDYIASESVTGTRFASKLKDLPFQVNVVTAEFMADFAAYDMPDQLAFVSNISPSDGQGQFQLRGFSSTPFVDGFRRLGSISIVNMDRVEVIKGPAASIYGQVLPGGVVNYLTKRPKATAENRIDLSYGTNESFRATASSTGPVGKSRRLFYRADLSYQSRTYDQAFASRETKYGSGVLQFKPAETTSIMVKLDRNETWNRNPVRVPFTKISGGAPSLGGSTFGNTNFMPVSDVNGNPVYYSFNIPVAVRPSASRQPNPLGAFSNTVITPLPHPGIVGAYFQNPDHHDAYTAYYQATQTAGYVSPANGVGLHLDSALTLPSSGWAEPDHSLAYLRPDGKLGYDESNLTSGTLTADHRFNSTFSSRFTVDAYNRIRHRQTNNNLQPTFDEIPYPDGKYGASGPTYTVNNQNGQTAQLDTLASFTTGPVAHKLLFTIDYAAVRTHDWSLKTITSTTGTDVIRDNYTVTDNRSPKGPVTYPFVFILGPTALSNGALPYPYTDFSYFFPTRDEYPELYTAPNGNVVAENTDLGFFVSERASFFQGRLLVFGGARFDRMKNKVEDQGGGESVQWNNDAFTYQSGLAFHMTPSMVLFVNQSSTYNPNPQYKYDKATGSVEVFDNEEGSGFEYGVRFSFLDSRLTLGASRFDIDRKNKLDTFTNEYGEKEFLANGQQRSRGYEVDFNLQLTKSFQMLGGYGYNDAVYTRSSLPYLLGTTTPQSPKDNLGVAMRYSIREGSLRGLSFTAGVRALSKSLLTVGSGNVISTTPFRKAGTYTPVIYNTPLPNGALPFPELPENLVILSANTTLANGTLDAGGSGLTITQRNKGYVTDVPNTNGQLAIPAGWVPWTPGTPITAGTRYYIIDGDGQTAASYQYSTSVADGRGSVFNNSYVTWQFGVGYSFRTRDKRMAHKVGLTVRNAFDKYYTYGGGTLADGCQFVGTYTVIF